ncbi:MAG: cytochrome-c peroxidase [Chitinophagaceae bacterium]|nr:MAG: cytochrome-c peroxidase [Chitinophagaceae bacterium]
MRSFRFIVLLALGIAAAVALLQGCHKTEFRPLGTPISFTVPPGFPQPAYDFNAYPMTAEATDLGRRLFYEGALSKDSNYSCGSCHMPNAAFTTLDHDRSHGYNHSHTLRNAPALANLAWYRNYFHDGKYDNLESVIASHITHPNEMGENFPEVQARLEADSAYVRRFRDAYGLMGINETTITNALRQFLLSMVSADSKWDKVQRGAASFTITEAAGAQVFAAKCATCHPAPLFTDFSYRNTGLEVDPTLNDYGRMRVTGNSADSLKFRVPSLRNLNLSSYYGHDGRYSAMRLMVRHYRNDVHSSPTLDPLLLNGIPMTDAEEDQVVRFLQTITDSAYTRNPRYLQ